MEEAKGGIVTEDNKGGKLTFGIHKGKPLSDPSISDQYIIWMALRGSYQEPGNKFNTTWKVPIVLSILARREAEKRGYRRSGDIYRKDE